MDWYALIKRYYENGLWELWQVEAAVKMGKLTPEQFEEITGEKYIEED